MKYIKVVIGANFGDEGKGLTTQSLINSNNKTLNILYNGGVQRGHTVIEGNRRHIFHCFGAGTFKKAATYYHKDFIVNPIGWNIEVKQLGFIPELYIHPECRVTTPFDVEINRILEQNRGKSKHGSCGMGIYETVLRDKSFSIKAKDLEDEFLLYQKLCFVRDVYLKERCKELNINYNKINKEIDEFMSSAHRMILNSKISDENIYDKFDFLVYEGGQGLLLSETNLSFFPYLTPSCTGSEKISKEINAFKEADVEIVYVTRSYMTRHGVGPFPTECHKHYINSKIEDKTNQPNNYQDSIRYGYIHISSLIDRINKDFSLYTKAKKSLSVTQLNYTQGNFIEEKNKVPYRELKKDFWKIYPFFNEKDYEVDF